MKTFINISGLLLVAVVVVAILVPLERSWSEQAKLKKWDFSSMKQIDAAIKYVISHQNKLLTNDNSAIALEIAGQRKLIDPRKSSVILLDGVLYDPWGKPYRFDISEYRIEIISSKQQYTDELMRQTNASEMPKQR